MNMIFLAKRRGNVRQFDLKRPGVAVCVTLMLLTVIGSAFLGGFMFAKRTIIIEPNERVARWEEGLKRQGEQIDRLRRSSRDNLDALAVRLGQMNAHVIRLDALGRRLTGMADLDDGEFNFENAPARGGAEPSYQGAVGMPDLIAMVDDLDEQLEDRQQQLGVLENLLLNRNLSRQVHPEGRPVRSGWISSYYGKRTDPFTGRPALHKGLDFAGRDGSDVVAVAAGVVTWSRERYGYGKMVEINHGNGYSTRYAHNQDNLVAVGDRIEKGQTIARMGSTGRATGPNLHFEVLLNGRVVNPLQYIRETN